MSLFSMRPAEFGSCCKDLGEAMAIPQQKFFRASETGVLYLTVGSVETEQGTGWMDQAVLFCPFCGRPLQTKEEIRLKTASTPPHIQ